MSNFFDTQGGFKGSPPVNHRTPAAGEWPVNPVRHRTIGETLAMEKGDYPFYGWLDNDHSYKDRSYRDKPYNDWSNNDRSYNDKSYNAWSHNRLTTHAGYNQHAEEFKVIKEIMQEFMEHADQNMRELKVMATNVFKEASDKFEMLLMKPIELQYRVNQNSEQLRLMRDAEAHKKVMELVQPNQLEGTNDSPLEIHNFEDTKLSCIEQEPSSCPIPFDVYYELFCDHGKPSFQIIESMIDENKVDPFKEKSSIDFIFPSNAFNPLEHLSIKEYFMMYSTCVVNFIENIVTTLPWAIVCFLAHIIHCVNRRRTKGPLAQPFDTCD